MDEWFVLPILTFLAMEKNPRDRCVGGEVFDWFVAHWRRTSPASFSALGLPAALYVA
jgi:hypothetical protein